MSNNSLGVFRKSCWNLFPISIGKYKFYYCWNLFPISIALKISFLLKEKG